MGPQILLDKSALQSLSDDETWCLTRYYYVIYTSILFNEVLGDLTKDEDNEESKRIVRQVSNKIKPVDSCFTTDYQILLEYNLLGNEIIMDGSPIRIDAIPVLTPDLGKGIYFGVQPEREDLWRWKAKQFTTEEYEYSKKWRAWSKSIDLEKWRKFEGFPTINSLEELVPAVQDSWEKVPYHLEPLQFLLTEAGIPEDSSNQIFKKWDQCGVPQLQEFAPYAYYCFTVLFSFYTALANNLIGTRATNRVDLEYLFYLPFCKAFSSGDKFHKDFAPLFLNDQQNFIDSSTLKQDLKRIQVHSDSEYHLLRSTVKTLLKKQVISLTNINDKVTRATAKILLKHTQNHWDSRLAIEHREQVERYPPDWNDSITNQLWKKYAIPRSEYQRSELTPESEKELIDQFLSIINAIDRVKKTDF